MRHLLLTLQYRGTHYHGFQVQHNALSVAEVVQDAVERVFSTRLDIKGCSRTDSGVHANQFMLTLRTDRGIPCANVVRALNVNLPTDIAVLDCREVPDSFHPRYSCTGKRYIYKIWNHSARNAFLADLALHMPHPLNLTAMNQAAAAFLGTHDFSSFCSAGSDVEDRTRTMTAVSVTGDGPLVLFSVTGSGFLYNMVRIMLGTLLEVGAGRLSPGEITPILTARDRNRAGPTAPPHGLYLDAVFYGADQLPLP